MNQDDFKLLFEVVQTHRFMMASAFSGSVPHNKEMQAYMAKMDTLQGKIKKEIKVGQES